MDTSAGTDTAGGKVLFGSSANVKGDGGALRSLSIDTRGTGNANGGDVNLGTVGGTTPLKSLTVDTRLVGTGTTNGTLTLNGNVSVDGGGNVDFTNAAGNVVLGTATTITIDTDATGGTSNAGSILFGSRTVNTDGTLRALSLDASANGGATDGGNVTLGQVGNTNRLTSLTVSTAKSATGTNDGSLTLNGAVLNTDGGDVTLTNVATVVLATDVTMDTDSVDGTGTPGAVTFKNTSTTNGAFALSIDTSATGAEAVSGGAVALGVIGNTTPLTSVTVATKPGTGGGSAGSASLQALTTTGDLLVSAGSITLNGAISSANVRLASDAGISQTGGGITTNLLGMRAAGTIDVTTATNNVATLAATTSSGAISYRDTDALTIGSVGAQTVGNASFAATTGVTTTGSGTDILIHTGTGLTLTQNVTAGNSANVRLAAGAGISQTGGTITANLLGITAAGTIDVTTTTNNAATLAATTSSGTINYRDVDALTIGTVAAQTVSNASFAATAGVTTTGTATDILIHAGTGLTLTQNLTAANAANVRLAAGAGISQTGGAITANLLGMTAAGSIDVTTATNNAATLAATTSSGAISYRDTDAVTIGSVSAQTLSNASFAATTGVTTTGSGTDILLQTGTGLTLTQNLTAGNSANVRLAAGAGISQTSGTITANSLGMTAGGTIDVTSATNNAATLAATTSSGTINYRDIDALTIGTVAAQTVSNASFAATSGLTTTGAGTDILIQTGTGLTLTQIISAANAANVRLAAGAGISQTGGAITANLLGMTAAGTIDVTTATNNAGTLAATTSAGTIDYRDTDALTIGSVGSQSVSNASFATTSGVTTTGTATDILIQTGSGLTLAQNLTAGNAANVRLAAGAGISQTGGAITANLLGMTAGGTIDVQTATNNAATLAATTTAGGSITYRDGDLVTVGTVGPQSVSNAAFANTVGITSAGAVTLTSVGLGLNDNITAASHVTQNGGGTVAVGGTAGTRTITATNGNVSFANPITSNQPFTINAGAGGSNGLITIANGLNSNSNPIVLNGTDWDFTASALGSIDANTSTVTVAQSINDIINLAPSGAGLSTDDVARIKTAATGTFYVGDTVKGDTVNVGGNVDFAVSTPNVEIRAASLTNTTGRIGTQNTASHLLTIATTNGATTNILGNSGTANIAVHNSATGNITLNTASGNLNLTRSGPAGAGAGTAVDAASGAIDLAVQSGSLTVAANGGGLLATGNIVARSSGAINVNDAVNSSSGDIKLVAGRASGMSNVSEGSWGNASGYQLGPININAPIRSGYTSMNGDITMYSTGPITQSATLDAGVQSFYTSSQSQGKLKAITFNDGTQAAPITLENLKISSANPAGIGDCGGVAGTGNCVGPLTVETRKAAGLVPPAAAYAESNIKYKSINGITLAGVGTAADIAFIAPSQTINTPVNGKNVFIYATAGDINLNVQVTNSDINAGQTGGSLNLVAAGDININAPTDAAKAGVSVGKRLSVTVDGVVTAEQFDHDLKLVATGNIDLTGSIYMKGDLTLRANASAAEVSSTTPGALPQGGGGSGKVTLVTQPVSYYTGGAVPATAFPLEVKATNIIVGARAAGQLPQAVAGLDLDASAPLPSTVPGLEQRADVVIEAREKLEIYTTGDINLRGGTTAAISTGPGSAIKSTAVAGLIGNEMLVKGLGAGNASNFNITAGTAITSTALGGGALASADAFLFSAKKEIDIGGSLTLRGGITPNSGQSSASANIDPNELIIRTGGDIVLIGGSGRNSSAGIHNGGEISLFIGGSGASKPISYVSGATVSLGSSVTVNSGVTHTLNLPGGLILIGGSGSGLYGAATVQIELGDEIKGFFSTGGTYTLARDRSISSAFITANTPRNYDSLLSYLIFAANDETLASRTRAGLTAEDSNSPTCN